MAVPKVKISKARGRKRRTHYKLSSPSIVECPNCKEMIKPHIVCKKCGFYKGEQVKKIKEAK